MADRPPAHNGKDDGLTAYAGRWIARLWDRIVGQGGTPEQALQAARSARFKEKPQVSYVPTPSPLSFSPLVEQVQGVLPKKAKVYLVGGAVRDAILNQKSSDLDFAVEKDALKTARKVANALEGAYYRLDDEHETGRVILKQADGTRTILDFAVFRGPDLEEDLRGRDFTINAMAVKLSNSQELLDPLGGLTDLFNKQLRACSPTAFSDDPVRILRAIRFAAKLNLKMTAETRQWLKESTGSLTKPSVERIRDEFFKILDSPQIATSIRALEILGPLEYLLPELPLLKGVTQSAPHVSDVWDHTLHTVQRLEMVLKLLDKDYQHDNEMGGDIASGLISLQLGRYREHITRHLNTSLTIERPYRPLLMLAGLFHDIGKPETRTEHEGKIQFLGHERTGADLASARAEALRLSGPEVIRLKTIVLHHLRPMFLAIEPAPPTRRAIYRFFRDTGEAGVSIALLSVADLLATYNGSLPQDSLEKHLAVVRALLEAYWERPEETVNPPTLLDGNDLIKQFKLDPGPEIGVLLEAIREAQAEGEVSTKKEALEFAAAWLEKKE